MQDPYPENLDGYTLCTTFDYKWATLERPALEAADWTTHQFPMRPRSLWARWKSPDTIIGTRFGTTTSHALIDIDAGSDYHSPQGLQAVRDALEPIGLVRTLLIRSSFSGGWHLYIPLPERVSTFSLACALKHAVEAQGLTVQAGPLEIFPNIKPYARPWEITEYNGHRLPLQPGSGSCLLDSHTLAPTGGSLERFWWMWKFMAQAQDPEALAAALSQGRELQRQRKRRHTGKVASWQADLRRELEAGWTGPGQTNSILRAICTYGRVFEGLADEELALYIEQMAYTRPGYLDHCRHQHQLPQKAKAWSRWATRFYWPLGTTPQRQTTATSANDQKQADARQRIRQATLHLARLGKLAETASHRMRQICKAAHASAQTLYKNLELWHPQEWCVMPAVAGDAAIASGSNSDQGDRPKASSVGPLHTPAPQLRCRPMTLPPKTFTPQGEEGVPGGERGFPQAPD